MAIRISTARLAAAVAKAGGIGVIAGSGLEPAELRSEIEAARRLSGGRGIIGVNIMYAVRQFADLVRAAFDAGIDLLISGAGFSRDMFGWGEAAGIPVVPIVGSAKLAKFSAALGADAVVVEGNEAGGHLGTDRSVQELLPEVRAAVDIPVVAAGGIVDAADAARAFDMGADGVQLGIRFAATPEANGADALKQCYLNAGREDIVVIRSPVGMPGRAIRNQLTDDLAAGRAPDPENCNDCLKRCSGWFCVREALCLAQQGDVDRGLIFSGDRVDKIREILPARQIIEDLVAGLRRARGG